ncbi:ribosomal RNA small subunit methyltransferase A [Candidatus Kaiserbacteria bacterium RIFCSPHIGHO2_02_FULL_55_25]|uniref:Ribosomal RNA small subunit methyltransferase A n=1 Tax=Candidatus Kaiserbacteria bacterium RIFCSPHIGHO2_02_FULL_55_25 TaxID=1798498 RepID=A0A1F6E7B5_9BACT|nr:MAG: ribosomal RNA small subunit methyltransferase A [Candidatus Kaiserbacteria bacterium RIFCSPHIGHO2_01_FULL_55_79]OGG69604.1 MAG: ribosomal RNA small subunit methyltransferase A [Candidatus Kaiserbacteria bacterium RIFCSPHIGHO2_02_FULL_55_25]OGG76973.1 MAG: ribosomal RNA small subunit methyltransferase A [Candidatus Kaiserbacteria bacterium RIFCSPHIGHO2_12_FULL_55_13]OGG83263.1 MAG: ribosomal RNA small subunit methyltransferase A [Candidatus Kaiserbacteria bacterium RIFCSPLOWO2_01_FULL_55_
MTRRGARLGQHFLKHGWAARSLAHAAGIRSGETFLEIGPGKGILTKELLALAPVVAIEKDEALVEQLRVMFAEDIATGRLRLVTGDVRDVTPESLGLPTYVLAANIPYYITGEIIRQFLTASVQPRAMALLVQKEVAQRIVSGKESILSLSVKAYGTPRLVEKVSRTHFSPPPSVDSAILAVTDISKKFFDTISEENFFRVVRAGFASKRKMLANNLAVIFDKVRVGEALRSCDIPEKARAEDVSLEKWKRLTLQLTPTNSFLT